MQQPFSNTACHCELAVQQPFFKTSQSCVCTTVALSHRFKSSPAIPGNSAFFCVAGYLMNAGHFSGNHVSSGDLNRSPESRGSQPSGVLPVLFVQAKRINSFSLQRTSRFCKPRISPPKQQLPTNKIKTFPKGAPRFCKPRINAHKQQIRTIQLNPFSALRRCPCRNGTLRVLFHRLRRQPLSGHHARRAFLHFSDFVRFFIAF